MKFDVTNVTKDALFVRDRTIEPGKSETMEFTEQQAESLAQYGTLRFAPVVEKPSGKARPAEAVSAAPAPAAKTE